MNYDKRELFRVFDYWNKRYYKEVRMELSGEDLKIYGDGVLLIDPIIEHCTGVVDDNDKLIYTYDILDIDGKIVNVSHDGRISLDGEKFYPLDEVVCNTMRIIGNTNTGD